MSFKSDGPAYTHIQCPKCGRGKTIASFKLAGLFTERGIRVTAWELGWFGARMRCVRCGTKGMRLRGR